MSTKGKTIIAGGCRSKPRIEVKSLGGRTKKKEEWQRIEEKRISMVVNDEKGVPVTVIAGKLCYYERLAKKKNVTSR